MIGSGKSTSDLLQNVSDDSLRVIPNYRRRHGDTKNNGQREDVPFDGSKGTEGPSDKETTDKNQESAGADSKQRIHT